MRTVQNICTWVMSLVLRVISDETEKRSNSGVENEVTLLNTWLRRSRPTPEPMRAASKPTSTAHTTLPREMSSICRPRRHTNPISPTATPSETKEDM